RAVVLQEGDAALGEEARGPPGRAHTHALDLRVLGQARVTQLPADARLLVSAERAEVAEHMVVVDPDGPGPHLSRDALGPADVVREDPAGEPVDGVVGDRHGLLVVLA